MKSWTELSTSPDLFFFCPFAEITDLILGLIVKTGKYSRKWGVFHVKMHNLRKRKVENQNVEQLKLIFSLGHSRDLYLASFFLSLTCQALFPNKDTTLPPEATTTTCLHNCSWSLQLFGIKLPSQIVVLGFEIVD